ncbi:toll/interleukin-1 receptor domain-containing protein [Lentzea sp. CC55]|uniref:toll/interleukin-1 receptor domain-containing protein n=1 Tax=Lentzea sp. CC55 TaxID=2884909 RepID=UPI0027DFE568|nr:toll/interleukin-1 receptor domain-containing protein [Lentzea sp. CC55]MCG8921548.1 toll/interleukin-1 receptor domain-containing protein [Lentzea sp. CC55]
MTDDRDFFVSYTSADRAWAEWVAWELEESGHKVLIQEWDFVPGSNWVAKMHDGVQGTARTIAVLSSAYLSSVYGKTEWQAAWREDPAGAGRKLLVLRVEECDRSGLLGSVVSADLFGISEEEARQRLRRVVRGAVEGRLKPQTTPRFPGKPLARAVPVEPQFPGAPPHTRNAPTQKPRFTSGHDLRRKLLITAVPAIIAVIILTPMVKFILFPSGKTEASTSTTLTTSDSPTSSSRLQPPPPPTSTTVSTSATSEGNIAYKGSVFIVPQVPSCEGVAVDFNARKVSELFEGSSSDSNRNLAATAELMRFGSCGAPFGPSAHWEIPARHTVAPHLGQQAPTREQCEQSLNQSPWPNRLSDDAFEEVGFACVRTDKPPAGTVQVGYLEIQSTNGPVQLSATFWKE